MTSPFKTVYKCLRKGRVLTLEAPMLVYSHEQQGDSPEGRASERLAAMITYFERKSIMRILEIGTRKHTEVQVLDEPGQGNANHKYRVVSAQPDDGEHGTLGEVNFQNGPIKEAGVNGVMNEDLVAIVIDRMRGFQSGDYACRQNALALTKLEEALMWMRDRTNERDRRGVEGTSTV